MPLGLLLTHPSTNPSMFETELQHNYIDLKEQLNVTAAVALANTQRPPTLHVNSVITPSNQLHTALIFDSKIVSPCRCALVVYQFVFCFRRNEKCVEKNSGNPEMSSYLPFKH